MKTSNITIQLSGYTGSGKTTLMEALNKAIREKATVGLETNFLPTDQFELVQEVEGSPNVETWILRDRREVSEPPSPAPAVPLGPNKTRDGREVMVLGRGTDFGHVKEDGLRLIVAIRNETWGVGYHWDLEGKYLGSNAGANLIGHLPPEPPKPREIWLVENHDGKDQEVYDSPRAFNSDHRKQTHFREVIK